MRGGVTGGERWEDKGEWNDGRRIQERVEG
jgi:hypothetical protein